MLILLVFVTFSYQLSHCEVRSSEESAAAFGGVLACATGCGHRLERHGHDRVKARTPQGPNHKTRAMEYFRISADEQGRWRSLVDSLTKNKLSEAKKARNLKDLAREFTCSSNPHKSLDLNKAFSAELKEELAQVPGYSKNSTLKVFLRV